VLEEHTCHPRKSYSYLAPIMYMKRMLCNQLQGMHLQMHLRG
jgi:hypothetical protein